MGKVKDASKMAPYTPLALVQRHPIGTGSKAPHWPGFKGTPLALVQRHPISPGSKAPYWPWLKAVHYIGNGV